MRRCVVIAVLSSAAIAVCGARPALGQQLQQDTLVITGRVDAPRAGGAGGAGAAEWLASVGTTSGVQVGGQSGSLGGAWWAFGRLGGFTRRGPFVLAGTLDLGGAHASSTTSPYWRYSTTLSGAIRSLPVIVDSEFQQFKLDLEEQRMLRVGASLPIAKVAEMKTSYFMIAAAGSFTPALSTRVDIVLNENRLLMGGSVSRAAVAHPFLGDEGTVIRTSQEWFVGYSTPIGASSLVVTGTLLRHESSRMIRLEMGVRLPVGRKRSMP